MTQSTRVQKPLLVRGTLAIPAGVGLVGAQARVRLEDTSFVASADFVEGENGPGAKVLVEAIIAVLDEEAIEFELRGDVPPAGGYYQVSAHVKANPDPTRGDKYDAIEVGDYITTQAYPVTLSETLTAEVDLEVNKV